MIRLGRFRILFTRKGSRRAERWYGMSVGYETAWLRDWKRKLRDNQCTIRRRLVRKCCVVVILGMALGHLIRLFAEAL